MTLTAVRVHSWRFLAPHPFKGSSHLTSAFQQAGVFDYRAAAGYVSRLPYGRIRNANDTLAVMREQRGTCSTKHAFLRRLAIEHELDVQLRLSIFEMNGNNTPRVRSVLDMYGLQSLPEAHCYLCVDGERVDATWDCEAQPLAVEFEFLHEEEISAEQIGAYKTEVHQQFLKRWLSQTDAGQAWSPEKIWKIREECILALTVAAGAR